MLKKLSSMHIKFLLSVVISGSDAFSCNFLIVQKFFIFYKFEMKMIMQLVKIKFTEIDNLMQKWIKCKYSIILFDCLFVLSSNKSVMQDLSPPSLLLASLFPPYKVIKSSWIINNSFQIWCVLSLSISSCCLYFDLSHRLIKMQYNFLKMILSDTMYWYI